MMAANRVDAPRCQPLCRNACIFMTRKIAPERKIHSPYFYPLTISIEPVCYYRNSVAVYANRLVFHCY